MSLLLLLLACAGKPAGPTDDSAAAAARPACLDPRAGGVLASFLANLDVIAQLSPAQASASKAIAFYQLPGVDVSRAIELNLAQPCSAPADLDPSCVDAACFWTECTGVGGGWIEHAEDVGGGDTVTDVDGWQVDRGRIDIAWAEGVARLDVTMDVRSLIGADGLDYTLSGAAVLDGLLDVDLSFPRLHPAGALRLTLTDSTTGTLTVGGTTIGDWTGSSFRTLDCD